MISPEEGVFKNQTPLPRIMPGMRVQILQHLANLDGIA
jgi:hypothetical protein